LLIFVSAAFTQNAANITPPRLGGGKGSWSVLLPEHYDLVPPRTCHASVTCKISLEFPSRFASACTAFPHDEDTFTSAGYVEKELIRAVDERIVIFGGIRAKEKLNDVAVFEPNDLSWTSIKTQGESTLILL
jgi:hypothetical protein